MRILILGAGVIGLTTAVALAQDGHSVEIWAKAISPETTSDLAAAFWLPYAAQPIDKVTRWASQSFHEFSKLETLGIGVRKRRLIKFFQGQLVTPEWASIIEGYQEGGVSLPQGFSDAYSFNSYVIDMTLYMPYLMRRCKESGTQIKLRSLLSISEVEGTFDIVVNCTGLGSRQLLNDHDLIAAKGQVVRIQADEKQVNEIILDQADPLHFGMIVPRDHDIVLGGTHEENVLTLGVDPEEVERIIADCRRICPGLVQPKVIGTAAGLRPVRSSVRLEREKLADGRHIIHNYGHGGAGVTLSWGCAFDVVELVKGIMLPTPPQTIPDTRRP